MNASIYTATQGLLLLAGYAVFAFAVTALFAGRRPGSKQSKKPTR